MCWSRETEGWAYPLLNVSYFYFRPLYRTNELTTYIYCLLCENSSISKRYVIKYSEKVIVYLMFSFYMCKSVLNDETTKLFALSIYVYVCVPAD